LSQPADDFSRRRLEFLQVLSRERLNRVGAPQPKHIDGADDPVALT
jgi:hypothetical protein